MSNDFFVKLSVILFINTFLSNCREYINNNPKFPKRRSYSNYMKNKNLINHDLPIDIHQKVKQNKNPKVEEIEDFFSYENIYHYPEWPEKSDAIKKIETNNKELLLNNYNIEIIAPESEPNNRYYSRNSIINKIINIHLENKGYHKSGNYRITTDKVTENNNLNINKNTDNIINNHINSLEKNQDDSATIITKTNDNIYPSRRRPHRNPSLYPEDFRRKLIEDELDLEYKYHQGYDYEENPYDFNGDRFNNHHYLNDQEFELARNERMNNFNRYNSMRHHESSSSYVSSHPQTYTNDQSQNSKLKCYMSTLYQVMMVLCFCSLIYKILFGNKQNDKYAMAWYNSNKDYFKERYQVFGLIENEETGGYRRDENMKDCILIKESPTEYKLTCSNYRYIQYITAVIQFHKRFDLSSLLTSFFVSLHDKIAYQVSFHSVDPVGWIFCICKKNQSFVNKEYYEDLNFFCNVYEPNLMDDSMCLISEDLDVFKDIFNNKNLYHYYKIVEPYLESIYYSDLINIIADNNNIFFCFDIDLTVPNQDRILLQITHFVNLFVDTLAQIKYSNEFKEKVSKNRILFEKTKRSDTIKKEIEEKEKHDFIEKWKIKNKMKNKTGLERKKLEKQLLKFK